MKPLQIRNHSEAAPQSVWGIPCEEEEEAGQQEEEEEGGGGGAEGEGIRGSTTLAHIRRHTQ